MIYRLLANLNYLFYFFCIFVVLLILTYVIYKIFIIDNDLFILNDKLNKIEMEIGNSSFVKSTSDKNHTFNLTDIIMNEVFNNDKPEKSYCSDNKCKLKKPDVNEIDIDEVINIETVNPISTSLNTEEPIFDLKKEVINDENLNKKVNDEGYMEAPKEDTDQKPKVEEKKEETQADDSKFEVI